MGRAVRRLFYATVSVAMLLCHDHFTFPILEDDFFFFPSAKYLKHCCSVQAFFNLLFEKREANAQ